MSSKSLNEKEYSIVDARLLAGIKRTVKFVYKWEMGKSN